MIKINCVLLVDDDHVINYLHKTAIEEAGVAEEIVIRNNGREGLKFIEEKFKENTCPELVFVDIKMPVMDGFEFIDEYQKLSIDHERIRLVMLTTSSNPKDIARIKEKGVEEYMEKPLTEEKLTYLIRKYFRGEVFSKEEAN